MQHIGIVAGSAEGAALCYRTICLETPAIMGEHNHPEITMNSIPVAPAHAPDSCQRLGGGGEAHGGFRAQGGEGRGRLRYLS